MKNLFLSRDAIIALEYRHGRAYRIAALTILAFVGFQLAVVAGSIYCWRSEQELNDQSSKIASKAAELNNLEASLKDVRQKLDRIRLWTPILARRVPVSSLLAAVETAIPPAVELDKLMIETAFPVSIESACLASRRLRQVRRNFRKGCATSSQ